MKHEWVHRQLRLLCFFALLILPSIAHAQDKIRVGLSAISATSGSIWVAEEKGLFKKHGVEAEVIIIGGGASRVVSSLIAGEIQFSVGGGDAVIRSALRGADTVLAASPLKTGLQRLMTRADIKTPADLKGKKIAITRFGSASHWVLQLFLRKWGMRPEDIQMLQLGSSPAMYATLDKGGVDGAVFTIPTFFVAEDRGYRILADPADMDIYYLQNSVDSTRSFLRKQRDQALRFVKAICEGIAYFKKHKQESVAVLQKKLRIQSAQEKDVKYLEASYHLLASKFYNQVPYATPKAVETTLEFISGEDPKAKGADPKSFLDESLVREVEASGFIKALYETEYR
ncbi:MAG: ABC transporter substrate-binding protein [Deltaproteobacteria bacterium]|nr:ABC transporter substrate-binding protein [Deltaproteobacteria bacterium]